MKTITYIHFENTLFIPSKEQFTNDKQNWYRLEEIHGSNQREATSTTELVLINCETSEQIPLSIQKEIEKLESELLEENEEKEGLEKAIERWSTIKKYMQSDSPIKKEAPEDLIDYINKRFMLKIAKKENVIYFSTVKRLVEE